MDELFTVIGKLYVDLYHVQKYMEALQQQLKEKDNDILLLKQKLSQKDKIDSNDK
jgi:hypothetical protein